MHQNNEYFISDQQCYMKTFLFFVFFFFYCYDVYTFWLSSNGLSLRRGSHCPAKGVLPEGQLTCWSLAADCLLFRNVDPLTIVNMFGKASVHSQQLQCTHCNRKKRKSMPEEQSTYVADSPHRWHFEKEIYMCQAAACHGSILWQRRLTVLTREAANYGLFVC